MAKSWQCWYDSKGLGRLSWTPTVASHDLSRRIMVAWKVPKGGAICDPSALNTEISVMGWRPDSGIPKSERCDLPITVMSAPVSGSISRLEDPCSCCIETLTGGEDLADSAPTLQHSGFGSAGGLEFV